MVDQVGEVTTWSFWISVSSDGEVTKVESIANATDILGDAHHPTEP